MTRWYRTHKPHGRKPVFLGGATIGVLLVVATMAMIMIPSGEAGSTKKTLNCTTISPNPVAATGSSVNFTLHLCNDQTSPNQLGSASITAPTGFSITGVTPPAGASWNPTTGVLANLAIAPGQTKDVSIQATTPSLCADPGNLQWAIYAKQSNDFSGQPGNNFFPYPKTLSQSVTGSCKLAFVNQPDETARTTAVRTTKWGAIGGFNGQGAGDPITVEVQAGGVHYSSPTGNVTIAVSGTNCGFTSDATKTVGFTSGYATFSNLKMADVASGCQLTATSDAGYLASDASSSFNVDPVNLFFVTEPKDAVVNTVLRDAKYGGTVNPPSGNPIEVRVEAFDGTNTKQFNGTGTVTMATSGTTANCAFTSGSTKTESFDSTTGVATFDNLSMANVVAAPDTCYLTATGSNPPGYGSPATSDTFHVDQSGTICTGTGPCTTGDLASGDGNTTNVSTNGFAGTITVNFSPSPFPDAVKAACGSAFTGSPGAQADTGNVILDPTSIAGGGPNVTVKVTIAKQYLPKPPSQGNPFIPICVGAHRVNLTDATVYPCSADPFGLGWTTQSYALATCVSNDGLGSNFWGLLGAYNQNPNIPPQDPVITQWCGASSSDPLCAGTPPGSRTFLMSLGTVQTQNNQQWYWDWSHQPA